tara:strand:- start:1813 stop:2847 length:1035 start_codon:yes stop_codon:yes gene_type:complete
MTSYSESLSKIINTSQSISVDLLNNKTPKNLYSPLNYILSNNGKQIRGIFALLVYEMFGGTDSKNLKEIVLAIEALHNFTLIHDDVMDNANLRRGKDTINKKWSNNQAILSGDLLLIQSYQYLLASKCISVEMHEQFNKTAIQICEGQQLDLDFQLKHEIKLEEYFKMIELKTAALITFSVSAPLYISTVNNPTLQNNTQPIFSNSCFHTETNKNIMNSVGLLLGKLFQIQDDYLDLYGKESQLGKRIGGDILEKKKTFLYIEACRRSTLQQRKDLINIYHSCNENKIHVIQSLYDELNMKDYTFNTIQKMHEQLVDLISDIEVPIHKKDSFIEFIELILKRNF